MPVASSAQKEPTVSARLRQLIPGYLGTHDSITAEAGARYAVERHAFTQLEFEHYASGLSAEGSPAARDDSHEYFNTNSPPVLNLSPNLSPSSEAQRNSPVYDLRESTRRRAYQEQMAHSPQLIATILEDPVKKTSESPTRKRRKLSQSVLDISQNPNSPQWDSGSDSGRQSSRRRPSVAQQRRPSVSDSTRSRRSPTTRRRSTRGDRSNLQRHDQSPERRAFQPPSMTLRTHVLPGLPQMAAQQQPVVIDMDQVPASAAVTMGGHYVPVSMVAQHPHIPICTGAHAHPCTTNPTWSLPGACRVPPIPGPCGLHQFPMTSHAGVAPVLNPTQHLISQQQQQRHAQQQQLPHQLPHHPGVGSHHLTSASQHLAPQMTHPHMAHYVPTTQPLTHTRREDLGLLGERRLPPTHPHHHIPLGATHLPGLNPSPPTVLLQEPSVHPTPHDLFAPFARYRRSQSARTRWRTHIPPPPPPYPGFLLHFLAMLGNPPVPPFAMELEDGHPEVENYEALLNLAERLGDAKPKGLVKAEIEQLPSYRFNCEVKRSAMEQTTCVVCMCDFERRQLLRVLPCSHEFHAKCVDKWLKTNRTCPICRSDASEISAQSE